MSPYRFAPPEPAVSRVAVHPVFLPFSGCRERCVFCAQTLQTGQAARGITAILEDARHELERLHAQGAAPRELAFYGGTFTLLPLADQLAALALAEDFRKHGLITRVRASTRPDTVNAALLQQLRDAGLDMLELGIQSFSDTALAASSRGYTGAEAHEGCRAVTDAGLALGVQLLPGMPGTTPATLAADMAQVVAIKPETLRLYPCLVLAGTALAHMWEQGEYAPWSLEETLPALAEAAVAAWGAGIRIIRMGLAPEDGLDNGGILAGPRHPALGGMVRGLALFAVISHHAKLFGRAPSLLVMPRRYQGEFWGHARSLAPRYAALGISNENVRWHREEWCAFYP